MSATVRPLRESDLAEADRIFRLAFGTFLVIGLYLLANVAYLVTLPLEGDRDKVKVVNLAKDYQKDPNYKADPAKVSIGRRNDVR